jgi:hypothetical protein
MDSSPRACGTVAGDDGETVALGRVSEVINDVANDIMDHLVGRAEFASDLDTGITDALNLMINATLHRLSHTAENLEDIAVLAYDLPLETILSWIEKA